MLSDNEIALLSQSKREICEFLGWKWYRGYSESHCVDDKGNVHWESSMAIGESLDALLPVLQKHRGSTDPYHIAILLENLMPHIRELLASNSGLSIAQATMIIVAKAIKK